MKCLVVVVEELICQPSTSSERTTPAAQSTSLMISSLYNGEDSVKPGHCMATANEPNTICPSARALGEDEFGCVPCMVIGGRSVRKRGRKKKKNQMMKVENGGLLFNKEEFSSGFMQNILLISPLILHGHSPALPN